jgi:sulfite reductase (NADPH) flavoprotein alpha-component
MAADVDKALHDIVAREGGKTPEQAKEYIEAMKAAKRCRRDVY